MQHIALRKGHFMVPFDRNECAEREPILEKLLDILLPSVDGDNCQRTAIYGLGGIGKTQVAIEASFRVHNKQPECSVFWIPASSVKSFENAYRDIGSKLRIKSTEENNADVKALVKSALNEESMGKWLLIIDDAADEVLFKAGLCKYLPSSRKGSILITTRKRSVAVQFDIQASNIVAIPKLSDEGAVDLLQKRLDKSHMNDDESNIKLVRLLEHLPLAIKQASAYMAMNSLSTAKYYSLCQSSDKNLIKLLSNGFEFEENEGTSKPVATTWLVSFESILKDELAAQYLKFICCVAGQDIPLSLLPNRQDEIKTYEAKLNPERFRIHH